MKKAYYGLLRAEKNREVLMETVTQFEKQLEQARGFFDAGMRSKFDVTNAEVELSKAKLESYRAENARRIARVTLNNAMGVPDARDYTIEDALSFQKYPVTYEEARDRAFLNRPDIRCGGSAAEKRPKNPFSCTQEVIIPRSPAMPTTPGSAERILPTQDGWSVGVTLTVPFFSGFLTTHQVREAKENSDGVSRPMKRRSGRMFS